MTTAQILTPDYFETIKATPNTLRVGIMAPVNEDGEIELCDRWAAPFLKKGYEVVHIPVGSENPDEIVGVLDGLLMPGGHSHIHPDYRNAHSFNIPRTEDELLDMKRDEYAIQLIQEAYKQKVPTLAICRGMQEAGVAFDMHLEKLDAHEINHAAGYEYDGDHEKMDEIVHDITIQPDGIMSKVFGEITRGVNSIHTYGFKKETCRLNDVFRIEALAPDNVVEAMSSKDGVILAVQAHPEFNLGEGKNFWHTGIFGERFERIEEHYQNRIGGSQDMDVRQALA